MAKRKTTHLADPSLVEVRRPELLATVANLGDPASVTAEQLREGRQALSEFEAENLLAMPSIPQIKTWAIRALRAAESAETQRRMLDDVLRLLNEALPAMYLAVERGDAKAAMERGYVVGAIVERLRARIEADAARKGRNLVAGAETARDRKRRKTEQRYKEIRAEVRRRLEANKRESLTNARKWVQENRGESRSTVLRATKGMATPQRNGAAKGRRGRRKKSG